ncbi:hypothetical protein tinsulaeT_21600 [Thalassotalea insulae]|uniref:Letm1 RBD domain-containing protein n=1 Tax=Thalassotalea insulae TaxID=2056778 RepID=A0ABQ6GWC4_9GAMM|nr:hypothetical protein [Thalassotalea insulae]GLX78820.1 hypothetical protein tinsulaeT_21600 [Thalassotalea insulae]
MRIWIHVFKAPRRVISIGRRRQTIKVKRQLVRVKIALSQEKAETKEMLSIYRRYTLRQATPEEMKLANQQFLDVLKGLGIGVVAVLPFAPITIPLAIKLGKWVGVEILPSSFNDGQPTNKTISSNQPPDQ